MDSRPTLFLVDYLLISVDFFPRLPVLFVPFWCCSFQSTSHWIFVRKWAFLLHHPGTLLDVPHFVANRSAPQECLKSNKYLLQTPGFPSPPWGLPASAWLAISCQSHLHLDYLVSLSGISFQTPLEKDSRTSDPRGWQTFSFIFPRGVNAQTFHLQSQKGLWILAHFLPPPTSVKKITTLCI